MSPSLIRARSVQKKTARTRPEWTQRVGSWRACRALILILWSTVLSCERSYCWDQTWFLGSCRTRTRPAPVNWWHHRRPQRPRSDETPAASSPRGTSASLRANKHSVIKPSTLELYQTWMSSFFCWTQKKISWRMFLTKPLTVILFVFSTLWKSMATVWILTFLKTTYFMWVKVDKTNIFGWTIPLTKTKNTHVTL